MLGALSVRIEAEIERGLFPARNLGYSLRSVPIIGWAVDAVVKNLGFDNGGGRRLNWELPNYSDWT